MIMGVKLDDEEKGIVRYLGTNYKESIKLDDIQDYLNDSQYLNEDNKIIKFSKSDTRNLMNRLIDVGYVRSKTQEEKGKRVERFYLTNIAGVAGGISKRLGLQGRSPKHTVTSLIGRIFSSFFILSLAASFFFLYPAFTGNVIGKMSAGQSEFLSFFLFLIALVFGFFAFKKK